MQSVRHMIFYCPVKGISSKQGKATKQLSHEFFIIHIRELTIEPKEETSKIFKGRSHLNSSDLACNQGIPPKT